MTRKECKIALICLSFYLKHNPDSPKEYFDLEASLADVLQRLDLLEERLSKELAK